MEELLKQLYLLADVKYKLELIVEYAYKHLYIKVVEILDSGLKDQFVLLCNEKVTNDPVKVEYIWDKFSKIFMNLGNDDLYIADTISKDILPIINDWIMQTEKLELVDTDNGWSMASSVSGYLYLVDKLNEVNIHSSFDPMKQGRELAKKIYDSRYLTYVFLGCGLGYLPYQIYEMSGCYANIIIFERCSELIEYGMKYGVLNRIDDNKLKVFHFENIIDFLEYIDSEEPFFYLFDPLYKREIEDSEKKYLDFVRLNQNTQYSYNELCENNYWRNIQNSCLFLSDLQLKETRKEYIVVAAGPSVDDSLDLLKTSKGKKVILAVGTIFQKLLSKGIEPDYVVVMDPQKRTLNQITGVENASVPMILNAAAYWGFSEGYNATKYMVYSGSTFSKLDLYAKSNNQKVLYSGGTVNSMALEVACELGADTVELVGVDLSYPGNKSHSIGTMDYHSVENENLIEVDGVNGEKVNTDSLLLSYIHDLEGQIASHPGVRFYNYSKVGARIKGTLEI